MNLDAYSLPNLPTGTLRGFGFSLSRRIAPMWQYALRAYLQAPPLIHYQQVTTISFEPRLFIFIKISNINGKYGCMELCFSPLFVVDNLTYVIYLYS